MDPSTAPVLPATLKLGPVELAVGDLDRSLACYTEALGLRVHALGDRRAALGAGDGDLVVLCEQPGARPVRGHAGLFHYALLYPAREELGHALLRLAATRTAITGASDHGTHEALYLRDPDGHGIELAADRPRAAWPDVRSPAGYAAGPQPLDLDALAAAAGDGTPPRHVAPGLTMGHVHLHVGDVEQGIAFYCGVLGFELMVSLGSAAFVSVAGYHHRLAFNVWAGKGAGPPPPGDAILRHWTIELGEAAAVGAVRDRLTQAGHAVAGADGGFTTRDPWGTALVVRA